MKMIPLSDKLSLSAVAQGYWRLDSWGLSTNQLISHMKACINLGVTTFDTAEIYSGTVCETLMGDAFKKDKTLRDKIQLVTKTGIFTQEINGQVFGYFNTTYDQVIQSCKESLLRLGTDYVDLYLIHREDPFIDPWETGRALLDLKKAGLVREIGVSNFDPYKFEALTRLLMARWRRIKLSGTRSFSNISTPG